MLSLGLRRHRYIYMQLYMGLSSTEGMFKTSNFYIFYIQKGVIYGGYLHIEQKRGQFIHEKFTDKGFFKQAMNARDMGVLHIVNPPRNQPGPQLSQSHAFLACRPLESPAFLAYRLSQHIDHQSHLLCKRCSFVPKLDLCSFVRGVVRYA